MLSLRARRVPLVWYICTAAAAAASAMRKRTAVVVFRYAQTSRAQRY